MCKKAVKEEVEYNLTDTGRSPSKAKQSKPLQHLRLAASLCLAFLLHLHHTLLLLLLLLQRGMIASQHLSRRTTPYY